MEGELLDSGRRLLAIEVRFQSSEQLRIQPGYRIFLKRMGIEQAVVISEDMLEMRQIDDAKVFVIPLVLCGMI